MNISSGIGVIVLGVLSFALLRAAAWGLRLLVVDASGRARLRRVMTVAEAAALSAYLFFVVPFVFGNDQVFAPIAEIVLVIMVAAAAWFSLRDLAAGFVIRAGDTLRPGDRFEAGEVKGTVRRLGYRVLVLESEAGEEVFVPYSVVQSATVTRVPRSFGAFGHAFALTLPEGVSAADSARTIRRAALLSHWHSPVKDVQLDPTRKGKVIVRVFALDPLYGAEIEAQVRAAIEQIAPARPAA